MDNYIRPDNSYRHKMSEIESKTKQKIYSPIKYAHQSFYLHGEFNQDSNKKQDRQYEEQYQNEQRNDEHAIGYNLQYLEDKLSKYYKKSRQIIDKPQSRLASRSEGYPSTLNKKKQPQCKTQKQKLVNQIKEKDKPHSGQNFMLINKNKPQLKQKSIRKSKNKFEIHLDSEQSHAQSSSLKLESINIEKQTVQVQNSIKINKQNRHHLSKIFYEMQEIQQVMKKKIQSKHQQIRQLHQDTQFQQEEKIHKYKINKKLQQQLMNVSQNLNKNKRLNNPSLFQAEQILANAKSQYQKAKKQLQITKKYNMEYQKQEKVLRDSLKLAFQARKKYIGSQRYQNENYQQKANRQNSNFNTKQANSQLMHKTPHSSNKYFSYQEQQLNPNQYSEIFNKSKQKQISKIKKKKKQTQKSQERVIRKLIGQFQQLKKIVNYKMKQKSKLKR